MINIIVTGSSGFIGSRFVEKYSNDKHLSIRPLSFTDLDINKFHPDNIDVVVHFAGIAHRMGKTDERLYFEVNHHKTVEFAKIAKSTGVRHFIIMSTIKVFGLDFSNSPLTLDTVCEPNDAYGLSKLKAENDLFDLADENFKVACIRPPVVFGPGVKGNIYNLIRFIDRVKMVPFGGIRNRRSMIGLDNLVALVKVVMERNYGGIILPSEPSISTTEFVRKIGSHFDSVRIFKLPGFSIFLRILKPSVYQRLFGSLEIDSNSSYRELEFVPPLSIDESIKQMVDYYKNLK